jgi:origin recognition complex subunit 6
MPAIRSLLKAFDFPIAAPNVFTGVESILPILARMSVAAAETPSKRSRKASNVSQPTATRLSDARILALTAVIFLYVYTKMKNVEVTPEQYKAWQDTTISTLLAMPIGQDVTFDDLSLEMEEMLPMALAEGWLQMEWFMNVVPQEAEDMEGVEATGSANNRTAGSGGVRSGGSDYIGLGTMMQDATDYLGERQKQVYKQWKAKVMARMEAIEAV